MKLKNFFLIGLITLMLSACSSKDNQNKTDNGGQNGAPNAPIEVTSFDECVAAGNPVMESLPRQCNHEGQNFVEDTSVTSPESTPNDEQACPTDFKPVCGEIDVQCIKAPCPPIKTTFQNRCEAEKEGAKNIVEGACVDENPNPEGACLSFDGTWLKETKECEGMGKEMCENLGGTYSDCASACRNNPEGGLCTQQCVQVCKF